MIYQFNDTTRDITCVAKGLSRLYLSHMIKKIEKTKETNNEKRVSITVQLN